MPSGIQCRLAYVTEVVLRDLWGTLLDTELWFLQQVHNGHVQSQHRWHCYSYLFFYNEKRGRHTRDLVLTDSWRETSMLMVNEGHWESCLIQWTGQKIHNHGSETHNGLSLTSTPQIVPKNFFLHTLYPEMQTEKNFVKYNSVCQCWHLINHHSTPHPHDIHPDPHKPVSKYKECWKSCFHLIWWNYPINNYKHAHPFFTRGFKYMFFH